MSDYFARPAAGSPAGPPSGAPGAWGAAPTGAWGPAPGGGYPPVPPPPPSRSGTNALVVVASVVGGLVVLGILAAVAIPAFLSQKAKATAQATSVSLPAQISGLPLMTDARSEQIEAQFATNPLPGQKVTGTYGAADSPQVVVHVIRTALTPNEQRSFIAGAEHEFREQKMPSLAATEPGRLGGQMRCATSAFTYCVFADAGAAGVIILFGPSLGDLDQARTTREAVEHRN